MPIGHEVDGPVVTLTIDGYNDLNPMTPDMYLELHSRLLEFEDDPSLRVAILRGAGDQHFSCGGNLKRSAGMQAQLLTQAAILKHFWNPQTQEPNSAWVVWETLFARRTVKPVIAAVQGYCLGAGLMILGIHTHVRIAGEHAKFGLPEPRTLGMGVGGEVAGLGRQMPELGFMWLLQTGASISAQRAHEWFLVNEVVPDERVFARAREVADLVAAIPPAPLRAEQLGLLHLADVPYETAAQIAATFRALAH